MNFAHETNDLWHLSANINLKLVAISFGALKDG